MIAQFIHRPALTNGKTLLSSMAEESVQLLSVWASPYVIRAKLALAFKNIPYQDLPQDLTNKSKLLLDSNPVNHKVPVLIHNSKPVPESMIIVQYIDEAWPSPHHKNLLPKDPFDRALARFWADYVDKKLFVVIFGIMRTKGEEQKAAIELVMDCLTPLEAALKTVAQEPPFFGGATIGYVDIILGPFVAWYPAYEVIGNFKFHFEENFPALHAWINAMKESPISASLPDSEKITEFAVQVLRKMFS